MLSEENISSFLKNLAESIELPTESLKMETKISSINWDSLAIISCIALADEYFQVMLSGEELNSINKIEDIITIISSKK